MSDPSPSPLRAISGGGVAASHQVPEASDVLVAPATGKESNALRAPFIPIGCWRLEDLRFEFGSSFIAPDAALEFAHLAELAAEHKGARLSVFGHADPTGFDENNKKLGGRRAASVYAALIRRPEIWEDIYSQEGKYTAAHAVDDWGVRALQRMLEGGGYAPGPIDGRMGDQTRAAVKSFQSDHGLTADGNPGKQTRAKLFLAYMDLLCRDAKGGAFKLEPDSFLGRGADELGKADYQGCGEFNPLLLFSEAEQQRFQQPGHKAERDEENAPNRRVLVLLFREGAWIAPDRWPCPRAKEGPAACKKRFWSDGEERRQKRHPSERRKYEQTRDTFGCRFYDRLTGSSPCERFLKHAPYLYGLQMGAKLPWTDAASLSFASEDGAHERTFAVAAGTETGPYRVVEFGDWRPWLRYKGEVREGQRVIRLFDYCLLDAGGPTGGGQGAPASAAPASGTASGDPNDPGDPADPEEPPLYDPAPPDNPEVCPEEREASAHAAERYKAAPSAW